MGPISERPRQTRDEGLSEAVASEVQVTTGTAGLSETASMVVQAGLQQEAMTIPDMGGRSEAGQGVSVQRFTEAADGYSTPRSSVGQRRTGQPSWLAGVEIPKWVSRLGSILQHGSSSGPGELAPSPFPSPPFASPPGGQPFRLRSPGKARAIPSAPTPPSSSSIPAEAIQAEVQRQLHGVLCQLKDYAERNDHLQAELNEAKAQLQEEKRKFSSTDTMAARPIPLLGGLAGASMNPGMLDGAPIPPKDQGPMSNMAFEASCGRVPPGLSDGPEQQDMGDLGPTRDWFTGYQQDNTKPHVPTTSSATEGPGLIRSWWDSRPRGQTPPPKKAAGERQESPVLEALAKGMQQLQQLQAQAMAKTSITPATEVVKPGTMTLMTMPSPSEGAEAALTFQDWLEISTSVMADISESSSVWWREVMKVVEDCYDRWLMSSPLERLSIEPVETESLGSSRWVRVNARAASMLLAAMGEDLRGDMVARRCTQSCVKMMFRVFTYYQPGGSAERTDVLKRLQNPLDYAAGDTLEQALKTVRAWPRWIERCRAVHMVPPDASVLARGLSVLTERHIGSSTDASFRTSMLRTSLRLDSRPTLENVQAYQRHLQAELEVILAAQTMVKGPKLKAVEAQETSPKAGAKVSTTPDLCRYFAKASGCRRGERCSFSHSMSGMDKDLRSKKCLKCGSESHRQRDCTVGKPGAKQSSSTSQTGSGKDQKGSKGTAKGEVTSAQSTMATLGTSSTSATMVSEPVQGVPWTIESLIQAAQQVVQAQPTEGSTHTSPEKTRPQAKTLKLRDIRVCSVEGSTTALVDSGATHSLRTAATQWEWDTADNVIVQLAGNHNLPMRITSAGTLLMPYKDNIHSAGSQLQTQTIVPMGQLIETLGYEMMWNPAGCYLTSPEGQRIKLQVHQGCPQLQELEALSLIARLEDRKLEQLKNTTLTTRDKVNMSMMSMERTWQHYLFDYVTTGSFESGLRAVRDAPYLEDLPGECLAHTIPTQGLWSGWDIMKEIGFLTRSQKRRLFTSKRWVVHLFAGKEGHWEIFKLDQGDTMVIELDVARCAGQSLLRSEVWRMLLWGAKEGKIDVIMGGPPGRSQQQGREGLREIKSLTLTARMMWLFSVAQVGREVNAGASNRDRDVAFVLEYPEGNFTQQQREQEQAVVDAEEMFTTPGRRGGVASWEESQVYWEEVQRPRLEAYTGQATVQMEVNFWNTRMWKSFQREAQLRTASFDQGAMGATSRNPTTVGTNVLSLLSLDGVRVPDDQDIPERGESDFQWSPGFVNALVVGLTFWHKDPLTTPRLHAMSAEQWRKHVEDNHMVYRRDCATCVMARGTGKQHRRVHHPESYVLTADIAGPLTPGLDATSKGTMGKNLKYLTVAKYMVPRSFVEASVGQTPPKDNGLRPESQETQSSPAGKEEEQQLTQEQEDLLKEVFGDDHSPLSGDEGDRRLEVVHLPESMPLELVEEETGAIRELSEAEDEAEDLKFEEESFKDVTMQQGDCISPEMTYLIFAAPLPNNQSATVKRAVQDVALYLQMHGFPIYRFHADKGEFFNHGFRNWLREQGIYATWSEPSIPQGNGHAESTVRWVKDRIRALLGSASLPIRLWPTAAMAAAAEQRARVLKWKSMLAAPYGSTVHLRKKGFDKAGPLKREHGLESKWMVGKYVGLSTILHHGHLVYVPGEKDEAEKFYHTMHVRPNLVDPGGPETVVRADMAPKPRRRIVEKTNQGEVEMRKVSLSPEEVQHRATRGADEVLAAWDSEKALQLVKDLASAGFYEKKKFGVYRHGGIVGAMDGMVQYPALTKVLVQLVMESIPEATFTSVLVSCNAHKAMHRDLNNDPNTLNYVVPVVAPVHGGELWIELRRGDHLCGEIQKRAIGDKDVFGQTRDIVEGESIQFHPRRHHEVSEWTGDRVVLIAYTPDCLGKLSQDVLEQLHELDFPVPISQLPEYHGGSNVPNPVPEDSAKPHLYSVEVGEEPEEQTSDWVMYLDLEPGLIKVAEAECSTYQPRMWKTEVSYTKNIESVLATLTAPLDVVHNVCSEEVYSNMEAWKPAIMKEVAGIEAAVQRLKPGTAERGEWLNRSGVQRLPMKFVFTIKPNDKADMANKDTWYKRKARLVICGNMAANDGAQVYTEAAPAEAVRTGLTIATKNKWSVAILDVVAAFIKTPLGRSKNDPIVIAQPPRLLETLGVTGRMELWGLLRALYGLREAPMLWGSFRDDTLRAMPPPRGLRWQQGKAITSWWTVRNASGAVQALIIVYVDDFMICGPQDLVKEIGDTIRGTWDTSELTFLSPTTPIRFLGMELQVESEDGGEILVLQQGYIAELLRTHSVKSTQLDKVPITKELMVFSDDIQQVPPDLVKRAQQVTGEVLWVSQRTRPDLAFATAMMSSMSTKDPQGVIAVGEKILGYLQKTKGYALRTCWNGKGLVMFCDAAFAPLGGRSHSGWLVVYGGTPLLWRSGRQQMVTLSSAEAELLAMIDGAIAAKGVESFLMDVGEYVEEKQIASDSMAALSISTGSTSWRTRHLRIKSSWLQEQISHGLFTTCHCPGERQQADLLTKPLSSGRIASLLQWWNIGDRGRILATIRTSSTTTTRASARALIAIICCLLMVSARAMEQGRDDPNGSRWGGLQVDQDLLSAVMVLTMLLGMMVIWEGIRWLVMEFCNEWAPGSNARRLRRLQKLQTATTLAIEREITRLQKEEDDKGRTSRPSSAEGRGQSSSSTMRSTSRRSSDVQGDDGNGATAGEISQPSSSTSTRMRRPSPPIPRVRTPSPPRRPTSRASPEAWLSGSEQGEHSAEVVRVCTDTCSLMSCDHIREGLRTEGLPTSGIKDDIAHRLGGRLAQLTSLSNGPTVRQLKYVLWLYRSKDLNYIHSLRYYEIVDRARISALIGILKSK